MRLITTRIHRPESFNATTSDLDFGTVSSQDLTVQTCLAYVYSAGAGESNLGYVWAKKQSSVANGPRFFITHNAGSPLITFGANSSGTAQSPVRNAGVGTFSHNTWAHMAVTWPGSLTATTIKLYVGHDGVPLSEVTYGSLVDGTGTVDVGSGTNFHIGNRIGTDRTFNGTIAYVARWNRILTLEELRRAQRDGPLSIPIGLMLCWANGQDYSPNRLFPTTRTAIGVPALRPTNLMLGSVLAAPAAPFVSVTAFPWLYYAQQRSA